MPKQQRRHQGITSTAQSLLRIHIYVYLSAYDRQSQVPECLSRNGRLTGAPYSDDAFLPYAYDSVGNRKATTTTAAW
jgi:hypothetical protein